MGGGAPPAPPPLMLGERAVAKLLARKSKVRSYYFDLNLVS
jgi:aspartate aminotransferase-like enzyme